MAMYQNSSNLEKVAMVTWKSEIAVFSAPFGPEGIIFYWQNLKKKKWIQMGRQIFRKDQPLPFLEMFPWEQWKDSSSVLILAHPASFDKEIWWDSLQVVLITKQYFSVKD